MASHGLNQCVVCSRLLAVRYGNACPRCRPSLAQHTPLRQTSGRPLLDGCPDLSTTRNTKVPLKRHVPKGARRLWAQCLLVAMGAVITFND
eukprot:1270227-Karenia_brevis.AAC.1